MPLLPNPEEKQLVEQGIIPALMLDAAMAPWSNQAVIAAMELEVFDHLREEPLDADSLANRTGSALEGMEILLRALVPLGYLTQEEGKYQLTEAAQRSLPRTETAVMGTFFKEQARLGMEAAHAVREAPEDGIIGWETVQSGEVGRGYQASMRWLASGLVEPVVQAVPLPDRASRMLDVGGSHGLYTAGFCGEHPDLEGTIIDWPIGLEAAQRTLDDRPELADRIALVERDFEREDLPDGFDFAFLGNIIHSLSPEANRELFGKLATATTDRGAIAILDQVSNPPAPSDQAEGPPESSFATGIPALIGFGLFLFTGGRSHDFSALSSWLADVGFPDVSYIPLPESPGFSLVVAGKPEAY